MRKLIYLDPMRTDLSRTKELFEFLKSNQLNVTKMRVSNKSRASYILIALKLLKHVLLHGRSKKYIIPFSAKPTGLIIFFFIPVLIFYRKQIVFDMGYPFSDIPEQSRISRIVMRICELSLCSISSVVLWESPQSALVNGFRINTNLVWYCVPSFMSNYKSRRSEEISPKSKTIKLLFRGNMNPESGIVDFVSLLVNQPVWKEKQIILVLQGKNASKEVYDLVNSSDRIELISKFLSEAELTTLIEECDIMIGQYGTGYKRLDTTIPHKLFEAIWSEKTYISPVHTPLEIFGEQVLYELEAINNFLYEKSLTIEKIYRFIDFWETAQVSKLTHQKIKLQNNELIRFVQ